MKDNKSLELLRYYLFEKMEDSIEEISGSYDNKVTEVIATLFSALVSALFADIYTRENEQTIL